MKFFSNTDKKIKSDAKKPAKSDKHLFPEVELPDLEQSDILAGLRGADGIGAPASDGQTLIFNRFTHKKVQELMQWSGIFDALDAKGYQNYELELDYLSEMDQRIYVKENEQILIHIRLKISDFHLRLNPGSPRCKLLYIDWLLTQHTRSVNIRPDRLFPGQEFPGLGIFSQISDFITNLAIGIGADGAFNIPEYFHDALLFHRQFYYYDPHREAFFRAIIRDLRKHGARKISKAFAEERIVDHAGAVVTWSPAEMISVISHELEENLWSRDYYTKVVREIKRMEFKILPEK